MRRFTESTASSDFKARFDDWAELIAQGLPYFEATYPDSAPIQGDIQVLRRRLAGESFRSIADDFGVSHQRIRQREHRMFWRLRCWTLNTHTEALQAVV